MLELEELYQQKQAENEQLSHDITDLQSNIEDLKNQHIEHEQKWKSALLTDSNDCSQKILMYQQKLEKLELEYSQAKQIWDHKEEELHLKENSFEVKLKSFDEDREALDLERKELDATKVNLIKEREACESELSEIVKSEEQLEQ